jgi:hypothetical protein
MVSTPLLHPLEAENGLTHIFLLHHGQPRNISQHEL